MSNNRTSCIGFGDLLYHTLSPARCVRLSGRGALIVTATDGSSEPIVWVAGADSDNRLHGFRGDNGKETYTGNEQGNSMTGLRHSANILVAAGQLYIAGDGAKSPAPCV